MYSISNHHVAHLKYIQFVFLKKVKLFLWLHVESLILPHRGEIREDFLEEVALEQCLRGWGEGGVVETRKVIQRMGCG